MKELAINQITKNFTFKEVLPWHEYFQYPHPTSQYQFTFQTFIPSPAPSLKGRGYGEGKSTLFRKTG